jgi:hypothetical protein
MFTEVFHSMSKGIHLTLEVKTSSTTLHLRRASVQNSALRNLDIPLTAVNGIAGRGEKKKSAHQELQSKT